MVQVESKPVISPTDLEKYNAAARIVENALKIVINACVEGAKIIDICILGDATIESHCQTAVKSDSGKVEKRGISFPTTVSPNHFICNLSPLETDPEASMVIQSGDLVKIEMGAHVDGFIAQLAYSFVVGASADVPVTGRKADVIKAGYVAIEEAFNMMKVGNTNTQVTSAIQKAIEVYECQPVRGMMSHQIAQNVLDGEKTIVLNPTDAQKNNLSEFTFQEGEAYSLDILVSSGDGSCKSNQMRTTVYKRNQNQRHQMKLKSSRAFLTETQQKFGCMAYNLRQLEDSKSRVGVIECVRNNVIVPFGVLVEKETAFVAHFMFTVLIMPNDEIVRLTQFPTQPNWIKSDKA